MVVDCSCWSQGFIVVAIEHADGTASTVKLAGCKDSKGKTKLKGGWMFYSGWGTEETRLNSTRYMFQGRSVACGYVTAVWSANLGSIQYGFQSICVEYFSVCFSQWAAV